MLMNTIAPITTALLLFSIFAATPPEAEPEFSFEARHQRFFRDDDGRLEVTQSGIAYLSHKAEDRSRRWSFEEIQELKVESSRRIRILTYEDVAWQLNRDRSFTFELVDGEVSAELVAFVEERLPTPLVTAVFDRPEEFSARIPAKHGHALGGGCDGEILFAEDFLIFESSRPDHSRRWRLDQLEDVGSASEFDLRVSTREGSFHFQLKRPLDRRAFEALWRRIHEPRNWLDDLEDRGNADAQQ